MRGWAAIACLLVLVLGGGVDAKGPKNHFGSDSSPYFRLHAEDLVHWRPWGEGAFEEARALDRPVLLSIGYSACHWCHVMRRESYMDSDIADVINANFVPVLLDREERPDVDDAYQTAAALMRSGNGWPLTMFLDADGAPFHGATYIPKDSRAGMTPFREVLLAVSMVWKERKGSLGGDAVAKALARLSEPRPGFLGPDDIDAMARKVLGEVDSLRGGFEGTARFTEAEALSLLWRAYLRTGEKPFADAVVLSLRAMARGGVRDHVGGGLFRYAVDPDWLTPHFEKMLDVNASVLRLTVEAWRRIRDAELEGLARETAGFLLDEMALPEGAFAAALDADSLDAGGEEREGAFYLWREREIRAALGDGADAFLRLFELAPAEEGEGGILHRVESGDASTALAALNEYRQGRPFPRRDDKVIADWSAMAVRALAEAGLALDEPGWVAASARALDATAKALTREDGRLGHSAFAGKVGGPALLADLGAMANAALTLYEATGEEAYLTKAKAWINQARERHRAPDGGGFFATSPDVGPALTRARPVMDTPNPSGNARMVEALARLAYLTGDAAARGEAEATISAIAGYVKGRNRAASGLVNAAETMMDAVQVVVIGKRGEARTDALLRAVFETSLPTRILQVIGPGTALPETHPAHGKEPLDGAPTAYVCRGSVCSLPVNGANALRDTLKLFRRAR